MRRLGQGVAVAADVNTQLTPEHANPCAIRNPSTTFDSPKVAPAHAQGTGSGSPADTRRLVLAQSGVCTSVRSALRPHIRRGAGP